jgi:hypothetical protein
MFASDPRIVVIRSYDDGWVPNTYRYRCTGYGTLFWRREDGTIERSVMVYDRKRSHGEGPRLVGFSAKRGRLASY